MNDSGPAATEQWIGNRDTYYWYAKTEARGTYYWHTKLDSGSNDLVALCEWAIEEASSAKDLARVATLVVGAGLLGRFGPRLESRIADQVRKMNGGARRGDALSDARWIGEALLTLRNGRIPEL